MDSQADRPFIIIGAGGHGRVICEAALRSHLLVKGFTDKKLSKGTVVFTGIAVLGGDDFLENLQTDQIFLLNGVGSIPGDLQRRREIFEQYRARGFEFPAVVHPGATLADDVRLAQGAQIMAGCILQPGVAVGENSIVNTGAVVDHDCHIGAHTHIAPGAILSGNIEAGNFVHVGVGAKVIQSVKIGDGAVVGAGAVVISDVPAGKTVVGVPASEKH